MKLTEIKSQVEEDMKYIPRGIKGSSQNMLRVFYNAMRMHDLAKTSKSKEETLKQAIDNVKKDDPDFVPDYDHNYFQL